jgi:hypothetical protein
MEQTNPNSAKKGQVLASPFISVNWNVQTLHTSNWTKLRTNLGTHIHSLEQNLNAKFQ